jgi:8-oxo-dGTP pyrophosphatase MutT (NUDIX family)
VKYEGPGGDVGHEQPRSSPPGKPLRTSALRFLCTGTDPFDYIPVRVRTYIRLEEAEAACEDSIVVIDAFALGLDDDRERVVDYVPPKVVLNAGPYRAPAAIAAAGGCVMRDRFGHREILLIHRRGAWDLPKGKVDAGESAAVCAVRDVREEVGIEAVELVRPLGETIHGYPEEDRFMVKTTYWFEMTTTGQRFHPQEEEGIDAVEWVPWKEAGSRLGYETLRRHLARIEATFGF